MTTQKLQDKVKKSVKKMVETFKPLVENGVPLYLSRGLNKQHLDTLYVIAYNLYAEKKYQKALQIFQIMSFYNHFDKRAWLGNAACFQMLKRYEEAISSYSYVALIDNKDPLPLFHSVECYSLLGKYPEANAALEVLMSMVEEDPQFVSLKNWGIKMREVLRS